MPDIRDKTRGLPIPNPVVPETSICFRISVPNALEYRSAFKGALSELGKPWNWAQTRGQENPDAYEAAELWRERIENGVYSLDCEVVMNCDALIECLSTNPATRAAIVDAVLTSPALTQYIANYIQENGLTSGERGENLLKPDVCDYGFIFNQASKTVELIDDLTRGIFAAIEVGTNSLERAQILTNILGGGTRALIVDTILEFADILVENTKEEYEGAWDEALYDELRCELFCQVKDSCVMTIEDIHTYYKNKLAITLPSNLWDLLNAVSNFIITGDMPTDTVVFAMNLFVVNLIMMGDDVLGTDFSRLGLRILVAGDEADNDWEILCEDCTEMPNVRLEVMDGYPYDMLEFIENLDAETSVYRLHRRFTGHYATGGYRSVGALPFYIVGASIISGTTWETVGLGAGNLFAGGRYPLSEIPCYISGTTISFEGVDSMVTDEVAEFIVSRNACPLFEPLASNPSWGNIESQNAEFLVVASTPLGGSYRIAFQTIEGVVVEVENITFDIGSWGFVSYFNEFRVEVSGVPANGTKITGLYTGVSVNSTMTMEFHVV